MGRISVISATWGVAQYVWLVAGAFTIVLVTIELRNLTVLIWFYETTQSSVQTSLFAWSLLGGITTLFTPFGAGLLILFAVLCSGNIILLYQYVQMQRAVTKQIGVGPAAKSSVAGLAASVLGIGCASCGTAILFSIFSAVGAGGLVLWLPLHGLEFSVLGIAGLSYAVWYLLGALEKKPGLC